MKKIRIATVAVLFMFLLCGCSMMSATDIMSAGNVKVNSSEYNYYLAVAKSQAQQQLQAQGKSIEKNEDWTENKIGDKTAADYAKDEAFKSLKQTTVLYSKGKNEGFVMDDETKQSIESQKQQLIQSLGGVYSYEAFFKSIGVSLDDLQTILEKAAYAGAYVKAHPEFSDVTDEETKDVFQNDYTFYVKHILIMNTDPNAANTQTDETAIEEGPLTDEEGQSQDNAYDEQAKAKAQEILDKIKGGEDFTSLEKQFSEDKNQQTGELNAEGYFITEDSSFDPAFAEAAKKLNVGEYTNELVKSQYGYHIIMRFDPPTEGADFDTAMESCKAKAQQNKLETNVDKFAEEQGFQYNEKFIKKVKVTV